MKNRLIVAIIALLVCACGKHNSADDITPAPVQDTPSHVIPQVQIDQAPIVMYDPEPWTELPDTGKPDILSIGDSISGGYIAALARNLSAIYDVRHTKENARNSHYTLQHVDEWIIKYPQTEVFVWNNGVWDITADYWRDAYGVPPLENYGTSPEKYEQNIIAIASKLKATGKRVIFITTTQIIGPPFNLGYELVLNKVARDVLPKMGVEIMDLYPISAAFPNAHPNQWDVHFTREANQKFADEITKHVLLGVTK